ncbi:MAG TPA: phosphoglycerate mutase family protein [Chryseolinea sp.]|nr:phosphoglycerate mutase family protein [Chryseolinea sp.]
MRYFLLLLTMFTLSCTPHYIYIVRHAEKDMAPSKDPALTKAGLERAEILKDFMKTRKIDMVYSTSTLRATQTAKPTADYFHLSIKNYAPIPDSLFYKRLATRKKNIVIVGHSNTVDDLVNTFSGARLVPHDLPETEYDNLFIIRRKGDKATFTQLKYGSRTP